MTTLNDILSTKPQHIISYDKDGCLDYEEGFNSNDYQATHTLQFTLNDSVLSLDGTCFITVNDDGSTKHSGIEHIGGDSYANEVDFIYTENVADVDNILDNYLSLDCDVQAIIDDYINNEQPFYDLPADVIIETN